MKSMIFMLLGIYAVQQISATLSSTSSTTCYKRYCYFWNGLTSYYQQLKPCPNGYWTLEIYDGEVQKEVDEFVSWLIDYKVNPAIRNYYALINLSCKNECIWVHSKKNATYFNFDSTDKHSEIYFFQVKSSKKFNKWSNLGEAGNHTFVKLCMTDVPPFNNTAFYVIVGLFSVIVSGNLICLIFSRKGTRKQCETLHVLSAVDDSLVNQIYDDSPVNQIYDDLCLNTRSTKKETCGVVYNNPRNNDVYINESQTLKKPHHGSYQILKVYQNTKDSWISSAEYLNFELSSKKSYS